MQPAQDNIQFDTAKALRMLCEWIGKHSAQDPRAVNFIGRRAIAAIWVLFPDLFKNASASALAETFCFSPAKFSLLTADFSRTFRVQNRRQAQHDGKNKRRITL